MRHLLLPVAALVLAPAVAEAHAGHAEGAALMAGLTHPVGGADHLLAMVAVGIWAAMAGGRALWAMPASFLAAMLTGGALGAAGLALPAVEPLILASVVVLGVAVALALRPSLVLALPAVALFGLAHGAAHGIEGPASGLGLYAAGFLIATALLHGAGLVAGRVLLALGGLRAARGLGAGTALAGAALAFG